MGREEFARIGDLELDEDARFNAREWRAQRIAWVVMALIIAASLLGAFGRGPLSTATARNEDGSLSIKYERILRNQAPLELKVRLERRDADECTLWISSGYLERIEIDEITPRPSGEAWSEDGVAYTFEAPGGIVEAALRCTTDGPGRNRGRIGTGPNSGGVTIAQFILP